MKLLDADIELITTCSDGSVFIVPDNAYGDTIIQMGELLCMKSLVREFVHMQRSPEYVYHRSAELHRMYKTDVHITEYWWLKHNEPTTQD